MGNDLAACMRSCWNWQTGMTKDHVSQRRVGSSPILRRIEQMHLMCLLFLFYACPGHTVFKEKRKDEDK